MCAYLVHCDFFLVDNNSHNVAQLDDTFWAHMFGKGLILEITIVILGQKSKHQDWCWKLDAQYLGIRKKYVLIRACTYLDLRKGKAQSS